MYYPTNSNPLRHLRVSIRLLMLPNNTNIPVLSPLNLSPKQRQPLPHMDNLTNKPNLRPRRHGPQISDLQIPTHTPISKLPRFRHA